MKTVTAAMTALFATRQWVTAKLFTFTLVDGTVYRYTSFDQDITVGGHTYGAGGLTGPYFDRSENKAKTHWKIGTDVDQMVLDVLPGSGTIEGFQFKTAIRIGLFDGADFNYSRINMATPGNVSAGTISMFSGRVATVDFSNSVCTFTINSYLELMNQNMPRNLMTSGCVNTLFDASCTLSQGSYAVAGSVSAVGNAYLFNAVLSQADGYFQLGKVLFSTGANAGQWRSVQKYTHGTPSAVTVVPPYYSVPQIGDAFTIYPGCDKTGQTCAGKFNNFVNFRGEPFIPTAETAL